MTALAITLASLLAFVVTVAVLAAYRERKAIQDAAEAFKREREEKAAHELTQAKLVTAMRERDVAKDRARRAESALAVVRATRNQRHEEHAQAGAPGGAAAVDSALDRLERLHENKDG